MSTCFVGASAPSSLGKSPPTNSVRFNYDDYYRNAFVPQEKSRLQEGRFGVLNFNRRNYGLVETYVKSKERTAADCGNDPLFKPIAVTSAKSKLLRVLALPSGKTENADKQYEDYVAQLMASLFYPHLDFAAEQSRTDSGVQIRDLIFYNNRSLDFLHDLWELYDCRQLVFELKNVREIEREHVNQLNRYLTEQFGRVGVLVTRHPLPQAIWRNTIDLWSGQRRCIFALTDDDLKLMVQVFETKQRLPIEVLKRAYVTFARACPS